MLVLDLLLYLGFQQSRIYSLCGHFRLGRGSGETENSIVRYFRRNVVGFDTCRQSEAPHEGASERIVLVGDLFAFAHDDDEVSLKVGRYFLGLVFGKIDSPLRDSFDHFKIHLIPIFIAYRITVTFIVSHFVDSLGDCV